MKYTMQIFWDKDGKSTIVPFFLVPLSLEFSSIDGMRAKAKAVASLSNVPTHSFTITSENGAIERWFQLGGQWRRKDVPTSL